VGWSSIWDEYVLIRSFFFSLSLALVYYLSLSLCCTTHILAIIFPHTHTHILCLSLRCKEQRDRHLWDECVLCGSIHFLCPLHGNLVLYAWVSHVRKLIAGCSVVYCVQKF